MSKQDNGTGIDLYTWATPNGRKVSIMLEELELPYRVISIDITKGEQHAEEFIAISPNNKIPVIVDHDLGISMMESGAILMYLAQKAGKLMSPVGEKFWTEMEWLMFQMGHIGPMLGQTHHFVKFNPGKSPYAEARYSKENARLYQILENRLQGRKFIADDYSIVDIATWPWISRYEFQQMDLNEYPQLKDWYLRIAERPAVQRGYAVPIDLEVPIPH
ncbi:MAG: glutathione S-transferase N-terminal domain-containing protein [Gammaproteobacteria bacterium]|nr:glutathione S-transferase N-terminal domain-containing protein [Gammaproteobacteria bacterium]MDP6731683.1 glutathione S-transferase N-terminal domain-containing protein [Gammaproteobacteria bacterium]